MLKSVLRSALISCTVVVASLAVAPPASATPQIFGPIIRLGISECAKDVNDLGAIVTETKVWWLGKTRPLPAGLDLATHINNKGHIAGSTNDIAALWDGRTVNSILYPGDQYSYIDGLNENGDVVGVSGIYGGVKHPFLWKKGTLTLLVGLSPDTIATGLNDRGYIVGASNVGERQIPIRWDKNGVVSELPTLGNAGGNSLPSDINNSGVAAGYSYVGPNTGENHAVRWEKNGTVTDLNLPGALFGGALDINNRGQVVGSATTPGPVIQGQQPFVYSNSGPMEIIAPAAGATDGVFNAINEFGVAVGCDYVPSGSEATARLPKLRW